MTPTTDPSSLGIMLDALSDQHRRRILAAVAEHNPRHEDEFTRTEETASDEEIRRVRTALRHVHLPKLARKGYIEWDEETGTIRRGPNFEEIEPLLTLMADHGDELPADWP